jgi:hypothetical protein
VNGSRWRGWLAAVAIFVFGAAIGCAGTMWFGVRALRQSLQAPIGSRGIADRAAERIGAELTKKLQLTPAESARVRAILDESAGRLKALRGQVALQAIAELRASNEKIAAELPPEKRAEYYRIVAQRYERLGLPAPRAKGQ